MLKSLLIPSSLHTSNANACSPTMRALGRPRLSPFEAENQDALDVSGCPARLKPSVTHSPPPSQPAPFVSQCGPWRQRFTPAARHRRMSRYCRLGGSRCGASAGWDTRHTLLPAPPIAAVSQLPMTDGRWAYDVQRWSRTWSPRWTDCRMSTRLEG
jgi:hypothetical protein